MVKRLKNKWKDVVSSDNLLEAYKRSRRGKTTKPQVASFDTDPIPRLEEIQKSLIEKTYRSGEYRAFTIREGGKERIVYDIDYDPHRIVHWALMLQIRPMIMDYIGEGHSFAAMEGRGSHQALQKLRDALRKDPEGTVYCLKMDVRKFFPSIDKNIMMRKLERRIKDKDVLWLCGEIIYGFPGPGLPIGNYTSQYFANFYLADLDRYMTQVWHCKHYIRYMDDIIILGSSKAWLHRARRKVDELLTADGLEMKGNWQIFPVDDRGVDFVGYRTFRDHVLLKEPTVKRLKSKCKAIRSKLADGGSLDIHDLGSLCSYNGVLRWCDGYHLANETIYTIVERGNEPWKSLMEFQTPSQSSSSADPLSRCSDATSPVSLPRMIMAR